MGQFPSLLSPSREADTIEEKQPLSSTTMPYFPPPYQNPAFILNPGAFDPLAIFHDPYTNAHAVNTLTERYHEKFRVLGLSEGNRDSVMQKVRQDIGWVRQKFWNEGWGEPGDEVLVWWFGGGEEQGEKRNV